MESNSSNSHAFPQEEIIFHGESSHGGEKVHLVRWKSGKSVDPRLLTLLKFFEELFLERHEFFRKIFPVIHPEFRELFRKIGVGLSKKDEKKVRALQRSVSLDLGRDSAQRLQRFKVRTPDVVTGSQQGGTTGQGGQGGQVQESQKK